MIVTLTMNPAIDRTVTVDTFVLGGTNRVQEVRIDPSGKGVNVSRALIKLGHSSVAMGFLGGTEGEFIASELQRCNIEPKFTWLKKGGTRVNTKIYELATNRTTEINELGPIVTAEEKANLWKAFEEVLPKAKLLICSGSLPKGIDFPFYYELIRKCNDLGVKVCLDTSGPALTEGIKATPYFIKPNKNEVEALLNQTIEGSSAVKKAMRELTTLGIPLVVMSLGEEGALFYRQGQPIIWGKAAAEPVRSTSGCGDALVAGVISCILEGRSWEETVRWSTAVATATAEIASTAFPDRNHIRKILPKVTIKLLNMV